MTILQRRVLIQHNIELDVQLVARMVRLQTLDLLDALREPHGQVEKDIPFVGGRRGTRQVPDVRRRGLRPVEDDVQGEEDAAEGVEPPDAAVVPDQGKDDGEDVEDNVRHGVLGEGLHGGVLDEAAPEPAEEFDNNRCGHDGDGGEGEPDNAVIGAGQLVEAFEADLDKGGDHDDGEDEDADGFEAPAADGVGVGVVVADEACGCPDDSRTEEIERGVD